MDALIAKLSLLSTEQLTQFLESDAIFKNKRALLELATFLNLAVSPTVSRANLIFYITKYFEVRSIDRLIRNRDS